MYANNLEQLKSFFIFIITGIIIAVIFDIFRILRKTFKTSDIITYIEDILFWIISGIIILISIFFFNNGELRLFIFIGIMIGITLYILFISKYFIKANITIINYIMKIVRRLIKIIKIPFIFLFNIIKKIIFRPISFIIINLRDIIIKISLKTKKIQKKDKKLEK